MPLGGHSPVEIQTVSQSDRVVPPHFTETVDAATVSLHSTPLS